MHRTFVGFGFGPIQAGLFLYEAFRSGAFRRLVIAEVLSSAVNAVRRAGNAYWVNVAHSDRIETAKIGPVEIYDPGCESDRRCLVEAVAAAEEISTAVPSVRNYVSPSEGSIHRILSEGLRKKAADGGPRAIVYAAENHNHAAEILETAVMEELPQPERSAARSRVRFLNTVIGKMSGIVSDTDDVRALGLATIAPGEQRAFLVEAFNRIFISGIAFGQSEGEGPFERGIGVFEEKADLLPFEEAKLYGHNATHALAAYLGAMVGVRRIAELRNFPHVLALVREAFIEESGEALIRKHSGADQLFTPAGYREYADDLLARMTNSFLHDAVERVGRDPARKLGWDDRLVGTIRLGLRVGVKARRYAMGAVAALAQLDGSILDSGTPLANLLDPLWQAASPEPREKQAVLELIEEGRCRLRQWRDSGFSTSAETEPRA